MVHVFLLATVVLAQSVEFRISPQDNAHELRDRVRRLEQAVQELQIRVFNLQSQPGPANDRKWFCEVRAFMKEFKAYGPTELEARQSVKTQCTADNHEMHCKDIKCQKNE